MDRTTKTGTEEVYTLKQAGERLEMPTYTLRKFCNSGLLGAVKRRRGGYRVLSGGQLELAWLLERLRRSGLSYDDLKTYARLERGGDATAAERKAILETQKRQLWQELQDRQKGIDFIERRIELLDKALTGD